jgi:hypothetical protein
MSSAANDSFCIRRESLEWLLMALVLAFAEYLRGRMVRYIARHTEQI